MLYHVKKDAGDESLSLLAFRRNVVNAIFLKYSKEGKSFLSNVGIQVVQSDVSHEFTHYQMPSKKQGRCAKITPDATA